MKKFDFTFLDNAREGYDMHSWPDHHAVQTLEDQDQVSDQIYCGLCRGFVPVSDPCVHHPGVEQKA